MSLAFRGEGSVFTIGGNAIAELTKIERSGAKADLQDVTNMQSTGSYREYLPTLLDAGDISIEGNFLGNQETTQQTLQTLFDAQTLSTGCTIAAPSGKGTLTFSCYISEPPNFSYTVEKQATFTAKLKITGQPTFA
jgi:hypothetical protein